MLSVAHRRINYHHVDPLLRVDLVRNGTIDPTQVLTEVEPLTSAVEAYKAFGQRQPGWIKVKLDPAVKA
jgi:threonine dehydrogenase-like Zn-dependent dehydrogenase